MDWSALFSSYFPYVSHHVLDIQMKVHISYPWFTLCSTFVVKKMQQNSFPVMLGHFGMQLLGTLLFLFFQKNSKTATDEATINRHYQTPTICVLSQMTKLTKSSDGSLPSWHYTVTTPDCICKVISLTVSTESHELSQWIAFWSF